jgi:hypothetical protein
LLFPNNFFIPLGFEFCKFLGEIGIRSEDRSTIRDFMKDVYERSRCGSVFLKKNGDGFSS